MRKKNQETLAALSTGMPVSPTLALIFSGIHPASACWHQGQSGTAGHWLVRHCPDLFLGSFHETNKINFQLVSVGLAVLTCIETTGTNYNCSKSNRKQKKFLLNPITSSIAQGLERSDQEAIGMAKLQ
jgi:hypothetical protein